MHGMNIQIKNKLIEFIENKKAERILHPHCGGFH
jgi:hypothetical protein